MLYICVLEQFLHYIIIIITYTYVHTNCPLNKNYATIVQCGQNCYEDGVCVCVCVVKFSYVSCPKKCILPKSQLNHCRVPHPSWGEPNFLLV